MNSNIVLTSKLVTINQGQYIVKVKATQQDKTIGSALACAYSVEEAEDKARERVLHLVNPIAIYSSPSSHQDLTPSPPPKPQSIIESKPSTTPPTVIPKAKQEKPVTPSPAENLLPIPEIIPPVHEDISHEETVSVSKNIELPLSYEKEKEETPPPTPASGTLDLSDAVDFSQVIDQTSIELKRLGWTQEQGKKYLLETYGKKSRHLLSDQELIEFLTYLQTQ